MICRDDYAGVRGYRQPEYPFLTSLCGCGQRLNVYTERQLRQPNVWDSKDSAALVENMADDAGVSGVF